MKSLSSGALRSPPASRPSTDLRAFRRCLGQYGTGVAVVTAQADDRRLGMTINSFSALSLSPAWVMWSIRKASTVSTFFTSAPRFAINILAANQVGSAMIFAGGERDPFDQVAWSAGETGEPVLTGVVASLNCRRVQTVDGGDHTIIIGEVDTYAVAEHAPLLFVQGEYRTSTALAPGGSSDGYTHTVDTPSSSIMRLLSQSASRLIDEFDTERSKEHLTRAQSRVLAWLGERPHTLGELKLNIEIADADLEEDLRTLTAQGLVQQADLHNFALTPAGRKKRDSFVARIQSFEAARLAQFDAHEIASFKRVLGHLAVA